MGYDGEMKVDDKNDRTKVMPSGLTEKEKNLYDVVRVLRFRPQQL